jgi:hypothetical protein
MSTKQEEHEMTITLNARRIFLTIGAVVALGGIGAGAFFGGQTTRMSDSARAAERSTAVNVAVTRTKRQDAATLTVRLAAQRKAAKKDERIALRRLHKKDVKNAQQLADEARNQGFSAGDSAGYNNGYSSGHDTGVEDGLVQGSDQLTCSDDPDVYWLPPCS